MAVWKNKLGHDSESELKTVIARMKEGSFELTATEGNRVDFTVVIKYTAYIPLFRRMRQEEVKYRIRRKSSRSFSFEQVNGMPERDILMVPGFAIWTMLEDSFYRNELAKAKFLDKNKVKKFDWSKLKRRRSISRAV